MTINEIIASDAATLTPQDIAEILGSDAATIRESVKQDPASLGVLEPIRTGSRVKFPRLRFINWYFGGALPREITESILKKTLFEAQ